VQVTADHTQSVTAQRCSPGCGRCCDEEPVRFTRCAASRCTQVALDVRLGSQACMAADSSGMAAAFVRGTNAGRRLRPCDTHWLPFVLGPALAMLSTPGACSTPKPSSANFLLQQRQQRRRLHVGGVARRRAHAARGRGVRTHAWCCRGMTHQGASRHACLHAASPAVFHPSTHALSLSHSLTPPPSRTHTLTLSHP
jgi:hypothetical protein